MGAQLILADLQLLLKAGLQFCCFILQSLPDITASSLMLLTQHLNVICTRLKLLRIIKILDD